MLAYVEMNRRAVAFSALDTHGLALRDGVSAAELFRSSKFRLTRERATSQMPHYIDTGDLCKAIFRGDSVALQ
jgi:hypothetical protein